MPESRNFDAKKIDFLEKKIISLGAALEVAHSNLAQNQKAFHDTFNNASIGLGHISLDGRWIRANHELCDILGYSESELQELTFHEVTHIEDLENDVTQLARLLAGEIPRYSLEKRYIRKNGAVIWIRLNRTLVRNAEGQAEYFITAVENIDEKKRAEHALIVSERRHNIAQRAAQLGIFDFFGEDDSRNYWSYWVRQHFGVDANSVPSFRHLYELIHPEDQANVKERIEYCMNAAERRYDIEYRVIDKTNKSIRWIHASGQSFYDEGMVRLCGTTLDITERKMTELAIQVSESRFRLALENIPDTVVIYDRDLRIRYINPATIRTTGLRPENFLGKKEDEVFPKELIQPWQAALQAALNEAKTSSIDAKLKLATGFRHCNITCIPLANEDGKVIEVMGITHDFTERQNAQDAALRAALHDPLTRLPNRILLYEYSDHLFDYAVRQHHRGAVLFINLDRFKQINDLHGHLVGDEVLIEAAHRIQQFVRGGDLLFRFGGDEFVLLLPEITGNCEVAQIAEKIVAALAKPYQLSTLSLLISASVGISLFPSDGDNVNELVQAADSAMYLAKQSGKNTWRFFSHTLSQAVRRTIELQNDIRHALAQNQFKVFYQPVLDIASGKICAAEALLRWPAGNVGPDEFIPAAEAVGQIIPIGDWVIEQACQTHREWLDEGLPAVPIAVNVSALQLRAPNFRNKVLACLNRFNLDTSAIQLELTESSMVEDSEQAIKILQEFRAGGTHVSLDDFGTGYSSLSHLAQLPIDKIKIDKSFVHSIEDNEASRAVTEAIVAIARRLNLEIVAEGVETDAHLRAMLAIGCHQIQGHLISHPCTGETLAKMLRQRTRARQRIEEESLLCWD